MGEEKKEKKKRVSSMFKISVIDLATNPLAQIL
jgi:hypothetical protein